MKDDEGRKITQRKSSKSVERLKQRSLLESSKKYLKEEDKRHIPSVQRHSVQKECVHGRDRGSRKSSKQTEHFSSSMSELRSPVTSFEGKSLSEGRTG